MKRLFIVLFIIVVPYILSCPTLVFSIAVVTSAKVDLNNNGDVEKVSISGVQENGDFVLKVDEASIKGKLTEGKASGFIIVDIDKTDRYKEIAVYTPGASDDDEYLVYWYDGNSLKEMRRLSRWPKFFGNGKVLVDGWMGFWTKKEKYVLNRKKRSLQLIPQEFYYVGIEATTRESFPIYENRRSSKVVARLRPKSKVLILLCDTSPECKNPYGEIDNYYCDWYLLKSVTGLVGWARLRSFWDKLDGLPWAD